MKNKKQKVQSKNELIVAKLNAVPLPIDNEKHLCPCYEQLVGIAYSLWVADEYGIQKRNLENYHNKVRLQLPKLFSSSVQVPFSQIPQEWATWVSGFYFNAALQRLTWVGDRLLTIFASLPMNCCLHSPLPSRKKLRDIEMIIGFVKNRFNHLEGHYKDNWHLLGLNSYLLLVDINFNPKRDKIADSNYIRAIRWDVNNRKHSVGGFDRSSAGRVVSGHWSSLGQDIQFTYAIRAFQAICELYRDLHECYFERKLFKEK